MKGKILLLSIAVISVGLFAMPSTLSLFAGQHTFDSGANVNCARCHQDIVNELGGTAYGTNNNHSGLNACQGCHRTGNISSIPVGKYAGNGTYNFSGIYNQSVGAMGAHAAVTMECVGCHVNVSAEMGSTTEAHRAFNSTAFNSTTSGGGTILMKGANIGCVGCHTHTDVGITWVRPVGFNVTAGFYSNGSYNITLVINMSTNTTKTFGGNVTTP